MNSLKWLWHNTIGIRINIVVRIVVGIAQVLCGLYMVWLSKQFIDVAIKSDDEREIWLTIVLLVLVVVLGVVLRQVYYYFTNKANAQVVLDVRYRIYNHLLDRQLFIKQYHSGDLTSRLEKDIETIGDVNAIWVPQSVVLVVQLIGAFLLMNTMDSYLAWILLLLTPLFFIFGKMITHQLKQMTLEIRQEESRVQMYVQESMEHSELIQSFGSKGWMKKRLYIFQKTLMKQVLKRTMFTSLTRFLIASAFGLGYLFAFVWGGLQLRDGVITFGVMTSFLQLVNQIQTPILSLLNMTPQLIFALASVERLCELERNAVGDVSESIQLKGQLGIKVDDVCFGYSDDVNVIEHFKYNFQPGSKTAIVGETGIGKTTIFRLLLAHMYPQSGELSIYNETKSIPICNKTRTNFVFVPQGNSLMSGSIRENLLLANPNATEVEMKEALVIAQASFVLELPQGLDTEIGERGLGLSEGQAQRIAIARGILHRGSILLLDEISSSLDMVTGKKMFKELISRFGDRTMLIITHRKEVCELCDNVISLI